MFSSCWGDLTFIRFKVFVSQLRAHVSGDSGGLGLTLSYWLFLHETTFIAFFFRDFGRVLKFSLCGENKYIS